MLNANKLRKSLYVYDVKDPQVFNNEKTKKDALKVANDYLEYHNGLAALKGNKAGDIRALGLLGIVKKGLNDDAKAEEFFQKQLNEAESKKNIVRVDFSIEPEITAALNNLGVLFHHKGDLRRAYAAFAAAANNRVRSRNEFMSEVYNLANVCETLGEDRIALICYVYCYRWYSTRIPVNHFRVVKVLVSILDLYARQDRFEHCVEVLELMKNHMCRLLETKLSHPHLIDNIYQEEAVTKEQNDSGPEKEKVPLHLRLKSLFKRK